MKRNHFVTLWDAAASGQWHNYVSSFWKRTIDEAEWKNWVSQGIIGEPVHAKMHTYDADLEDVPHTVSYYEGRRKIFCKGRHGEQTERPRDLELDIFMVSLDHLTKYITKKWGITSDLNDAPPHAHLVGWRDDSIPVVIFTDLGGFYPITAAIEIQENLRFSTMYALHVRNYRPSDMELARLYSRGIIFLSIDQFLSDDGQPDWDFNPVERMHGSLPPSLKITVDRATGKFRYDGSILNLSKTETLLFRVLSASFGVIVRRSELLNVLYIQKKHKPADPDRALNLQVHYLKKKLEKATDLTIDTIKSEGIRLIWCDQSENSSKSNLKTK